MKMGSKSSLYMLTHFTTLYFTTIQNRYKMFFTTDLKRFICSSGLWLKSDTKDGGNGVLGW